jgi:hypothetical protein
MYCTQFTFSADAFSRSSLETELEGVKRTLSLGEEFRRERSSSLLAYSRGDFSSGSSPASLSETPDKLSSVQEPQTSALQSAQTSALRSRPSSASAKLFEMEERKCSSSKSLSSSAASKERARQLADMLLRGEMEGKLSPRVVCSIDSVLGVL